MQTNNPIKTTDILPKGNSSLPPEIMYRQSHTSRKLQPLWLVRQWCCQSLQKLATDFAAVEHLSRKQQLKFLCYVVCEWSRLDHKDLKQNKCICYSIKKSVQRHLCRPQTIPRWSTESTTPVMCSLIKVMTSRTVNVNVGQATVELFPNGSVPP